MISKQKGLSASINGILGLSPAVSDNGPSYIGALYKQGKISKEVVSF